MAFFIKRTSPRLQLDPIECGAVCLGIILEYLGHYTTNLNLRKACLTSRHGSQALGLIYGARLFGLIAQSKKILASDLKHHPGLAILFFDQCHFVVYEGYFWGRYYINDPAAGRYSLHLKDFHQRYSKVAIFFTKDQGFQRKPRPALAPQEGGLTTSFLVILGVMGGVALAFCAAFIGLMFSKPMLLSSAPGMLSIFLAFSIIFILSLVMLWRVVMFVAQKRGIL